MRRVRAEKSLVFAVVLLVVGFEAITPDAADLASSMAFHILGARSADTRGPSNDDGYDEGVGEVAGPAIESRASRSRIVRSPGKQGGYSAGLLVTADDHVRPFSMPVVRASSVLDPLHVCSRLNC